MNTLNAPDEISLRLLGEFTREPEISQRALAARLGIALGLVNAYIKRLYKKGHIKIKTLPRNRIKYIITPAGFVEKARLTYIYMNCSIHYFREIRTNIEQIYTAMMDAGVGKILLWGDGEIAELCFLSTRGLPLIIVGVVSDNKINKDFFGVPVLASTDIENIEYDAILVSSLDATELGKLEDMVYKNKKVFNL